MLDDNYRIASVRQSVQYLHQLVHILKMQSCGRLIQNIYRLTGTSPGEFGCQFDTLCLTSGQGGGGLSQLHIGKSHVIQGLDLPADKRHIFEERQCFFHRHVQHIKDALALVFHIQRLTIVAFAATDLAGDIDIRQEMHLDLNDTVTTAGFTSSALDIKAETSLAVPFRLGICGGSEQVTDQIKHSGIGSRVGSGGTSDGRLVDIDDLVQLLHTFDSFMFAGDAAGTVQFSCQMLIEDLIHQRTFAGAGHTGDAGHHAQRDFHIYIFQIIFLCSQYFDPAGRCASGLRYGNPLFAAEVLSRNGFRDLHDLLCGTTSDDFTAVGAGTGSDIYDIIRCQHGIFIMFYHYQSIAQIPQILQGIQQFVIVSLVQADTGLIQNIADTYQTGTDLGCQTDTLCLTTGQSSGSSRQRQILQSHIHQEAYSGADLFQHTLADELLLFRQGHGVQELLQIPDGHGSDLENIFIAYCNCQRFLFQTHALTFLTGSDAHKGLVFLLGALRSGLTITSLHIFDQAFKGDGIYTAATLTGIMHQHLFAVRSVDQDVMNLLRIIFKRRIQVKMIFLCQRL